MLNIYLRDTLIDKWQILYMLLRGYWVYLIPKETDIRKDELLDIVYSYTTPSKGVLFIDASARKYLSKTEDPLKLFQLLITHDEEIALFMSQYINVPGLDVIPNVLTEIKYDPKEQPIIGRQVELYKIRQILKKVHKSNIILVGKAGVGKSAIMKALVERTPYSVYALDIQAVTKAPSALNRIKHYFKKHPNSVLYIDEIHRLTSDKTMADEFKLFLDGFTGSVVGATTEDEYKSIEKDKALMRRFVNLHIQEPSPEYLFRILHDVAPYYEQKHTVKYDSNTLLYIMELSKNYMHERNEPDKSIDIIDQVGAAMELYRNYMYYGNLMTTDKYDVKESSAYMKLALGSHKLYDDIMSMAIKDYKEHYIELDKERERYKLFVNYTEAARNAQDISSLYYLTQALMAEYELVQNNEYLTIHISKPMVDEVIASITDIPVGEVKGDEKTRIVNLEKNLNAKVIGQEDAIKSITASIRRYRSGIFKRQKPMGVFLLLGPTGVGKTYTAKCLAEELYGDSKALIRYDMSEYMQAHNVSKFIGSPPGYVGYDDGGQLTEAVKRNPYSILLFDEIEKAHPAVLNIFLQIFDDGRLTDSYGDVVDFTNTIILLTSNIGSREIARLLDIGNDDKNEYDKIKEKVEAVVKKNLTPELINRLDDKIIYKPLGLEALVNIIKLQLDDLADNLYNNKGITLTYTKDVIYHIYTEVCAPNPEYGARPINREINNVIVSKIVDKLYEGDYMTMNLSCKDSKYVLNCKK